jgi:hypothetical protein
MQELQNEGRQTNISREKLGELKRKVSLQD